VFGAFGPILFGEGEAGEDGADFGFEGVAVAVAEGGVEFVVAVGGGGVFGGGRVEFGERVGEGFELALHVLEFVEDGEALGEDGAAGEAEAILGEVAGGDALLEGGVAGVGGIEAGEDFEDGGFAGAVGADEADAVLGGDEPVDAFEEELGAEAFAGVDEGDHVLLGAFYCFATGPQKKWKAWAR